MMRARLKLLLAMLVGLSLYSLFIPAMIYASQLPPDSGPYIVSYYAYENTYTSGDVTILLEYNIPYASLPTATASSNFFFRYMDATGNITNVVTPYAYENLGYGYGAAAFYFAPGAITWGESSFIQLVGNPTVSWNGTLPIVSQPMMASNWVTSNSTLQGRAQVCSYIISTLAVDLENRWNVALTSQSSTGTVLNAAYGQQYFSNIIPYFTTVCSAILIVTGQQPVNPPSPTTWPTQPTVLYSTGLATFTQGSANVSGAGTAWTINMTSAFIKTSLDNEWFQVGGVQSGTQLTMAITYPFATESGVGYQIATLPYQIGLGKTWQNSILGPSINQAAKSVGVPTEMWMLGAFVVVMFFVLGFVATATGGASLPLIAVPILIGCIKIGVVPMPIGVAICALCFILSMFLLIHRRAAV